MISTPKLTEIYNKWGDEQKLQPLGCAFEEVMGNEQISDAQRNWLLRFVEAWKYAQDIEEKMEMNDGL